MFFSFPSGPIWTICKFYQFCLQNVSHLTTCPQFHHHSSVQGTNMLCINSYSSLLNTDFSASTLNPYSIPLAMQSSRRIFSEQKSQSTILLPETLTALRIKSALLTKSWFLFVTLISLCFVFPLLSHLPP